MRIGATFTFLKTPASGLLTFFFFGLEAELQRVVAVAAPGSGCR